MYVGNVSKNFWHVMCSKWQAITEDTRLRYALQSIGTYAASNTIRSSANNVSKREIIT